MSFTMILIARRALGPVPNAARSVLSAASRSGRRRAISTHSSNSGVLDRALPSRLTPKPLPAPDPVLNALSRGW